jgi:hypothetical protein
VTVEGKAVTSNNVTSFANAPIVFKTKCVK